MIFLKIVRYFYYLCVLRLLVKEFLDQEGDPGSVIHKLSQLMQINYIFITHLGRMSTNYTR